MCLITYIQNYKNLEINIIKNPDTTNLEKMKLSDVSNLVARFCNMDKYTFVEETHQKIIVDEQEKSLDDFINVNSDTIVNAKNSIISTENITSEGSISFTAGLDSLSEEQRKALTGFLSRHK